MDPNYNQNGNNQYYNNQQPMMNQGMPQQQPMIQQQPMMNQGMQYQQVGAPNSAQAKKNSIANLLIVFANLLYSLVGALNGKASLISMVVLCCNLLMTIISLKNSPKKGSVILCLVVELLTAVFIVIGIIN